MIDYRDPKSLKTKPAKDIHWGPTKTSRCFVLDQCKINKEIFDALCVDFTLIELGTTP